MSPARGLQVAALIAAGLAAAGCVGTSAQLNAFKKAEGAGNLADIESKPLDSSCAASAKGSAECAQLAEIQGRACLTLARGEAAPHAACPPATASAIRRLRCAAEDFAAARVGHQLSNEEFNDLGEMRARALYCEATTEARSQGVVEAREASRELDALPADSQRDQLAAAASLYVANSDELPSSERCSAAMRADGRAARGLSNDPPDDLKQELEDTRRHAASVAVHLTNCRLP